MSSEGSGSAAAIRDSATFIGVLAIGWVLATVFGGGRGVSASTAAPSSPCNCVCSVGLPPPAVVLPLAPVTAGGAGP